MPCNGYSTAWLKGRKVVSDMDILRRIAERGLKLAQDEDHRFIDLFQHLLDELPRVEQQHQEALAKARCGQLVPAEIVLEGEILPPETPLHQQARELVEELQAKGAALNGGSRLRI